MEKKKRKPMENKGKVKKMKRKSMEKQRKLTKTNGKQRKSEENEGKLPHSGQSNLAQRGHI